MSKRLTPGDVERIIEMKLDRSSVRAIAAEVGCSPVTVQKRWNDYLDQRATDANDQARREHSRVLANLARMEDDAYRGYMDAKVRAAEDTTADDEEGGFSQGPAWANVAKGFLAEARQAAREYARLSGMDQPSRLELTGAAGGPVEIVPADLVNDALAQLAAITTSKRPAEDEAEDA